LAKQPKYVIYVENRSIVVPGDVVAAGDVAIETPHLLHRLPDGRIVAMVTGLVEVEQSDDRASIKLIPLKGRYIPKEGDIVIGVVCDIGITAWFVDIRAPFTAVLNASDYLGGKPFNPATDNLRKYLDVGDVIIAKVAQFDRTRDPILTVQEKGLGKVVEGSLIEIEPSRVPRVIGRKRSMISMIQELTQCNIVVGNNGRILLKCPNPEIEAVAILAIKKIEAEAHTQGLTERVREFIIEEKIKRGLISRGVS